MAKKDQGIGMEGGNEGSWPGYASANPRNRLDGKEESDSEMDYGRPSVTGLSVSRPRKFSFPRLIVVYSFLAMSSLSCNPWPSSSWNRMPMVRKRKHAVDGQGTLREGRHLAKGRERLTVVTGRRLHRYPLLDGLSTNCNP